MPEPVSDIQMKSIVFDLLPVHDTCWSITTGVDGNIYIGVCGELTGGLSVFIVRYNPREDTLEYLLEVSPALGEPSDSGRPPLSKIHYCLLPGDDGRLYCATHYSGPPIGHRIWRPWHTWDDHETMARGFHIFAFDPETEAVEDYGIMSPNEGGRAMALAENRGFIYGITWPRNHFYVFDIMKRTYRDLGRIGDLNAQAVWIDRAGNGYTVDDLGYIVKYDADADTLRHLDARLPKVPDYPGEARCTYDVTPSSDGKAVYGTVWNMEWFPFAERLFRWDFRGDHVEDLGAGVGRDKLDHIGGLVFGDDGFLYYAASEKDPNRRVPYRFYLFRMNPETLEKEKVCPFDDGDWHSEYIAKGTADFAGNFYFADANNRPSRIYVYTPPGTTGEFDERRPILKKWG